MAEIEMAFHTCPSCGIAYGVPAKFDQARREDGRNFYCPNGDSLLYGNGENARLKKELEGKGRSLQFLQKRNAELRAQVERLRRSRDGTKGALARLRKRTETATGEVAGEKERSE